MAAYGTAIGDDHVTRSRRPNWTICYLWVRTAPAGLTENFAMFPGCQVTGVLACLQV
jgi:hypothetical protein